MNTFKDPKCLILKRDRDELIASFMQHWLYENYWTDPGSDHWDNQWPKPTIDHPDPDRLSVMWPKYDLPKEDAIGAYWDEYYAIARYWQDRLPANVLVMDFKESLNTFEGQDRALDFFDIPAEKRQYYVGVKLNQAGLHRGILYKEKESVHGTIRIHEDPTIARQEIIMQLRGRPGAIRGDMEEAMGREYPIIPGGDGDRSIPVPGAEGHRLSEPVGHGGDVGERTPDDGDIVHGEGSQKAAGRDQG